METNAGAGMGDGYTITATFRVGARIRGAPCRKIGSPIPPGFAQARANTAAKGNAEQRDAGSKLVEGLRCRGGTECVKGFQNSCRTGVDGGRRSRFKMD